MDIWTGFSIAVVGGAGSFSFAVEEWEDLHQLVVAGLRAVLADFKALGILDGLSLLLAEKLDELGPEPIGQSGVALGDAVACPG